MTNVHNPDKPDFCATYALPPDQAVVAAFELYERRNGNWWGYPEPAEHPQYQRTKHGHQCGMYWAKDSDSVKISSLI